MSRVLIQLSRSTIRPLTISSRTFSVSSRLAKDSQLAKMAPNTERPEKELVHFPGITSEVRSFGDFRRVLHTGLYSQLVAMEIPVGGDIGEEVHTVDQILIFTSGTARATVSGKDRDVKANDICIVPAGSKHQFVNTGKTPLELVTVYAPAEHKTTTVHKTKEEGDKLEDDGEDEAPEWSQQSKDYNEKKGIVKGEE